MKKLVIAAVVVAAGVVGASLNVSANNTLVSVVSTSVDPIEDKITAEFKTIGLEVSEISESPITGLYEVITNRGVLYSTADGKYLVQGTLLDLKKKENLTELAMGKVRKAGIKQFEDSMIVYPAKNEKYKVTIFTDITCGYCRKLHRELDDYLAAGITIQYLAFPRAGLQGKGYQDLKNIWCAADNAQALTDAKAGSDVASVADCDMPVKEQFELGKSLGITGTPAIILEDGSLIPGYQPAADLKNALDNMSNG
jgi:thiol:disulfide interchange protein DsbC